jgi:hypothetical protein
MDARTGGEAVRNPVITASTMGQANPAHVGEGGHYRWRYRDFCALRGEGKSPEEAARILELRAGMADGYEAARLADLETP